MNRRDFAKLSLLSVGGLAGCKETDSVVNAIDSHCHVWDKDGMANKPPYPFETIDQVAAPTGIQRFVVVVLYAESNESYVLKLRELYPERIGIISLLDPEDSELEAKMIANRKKGILGYRLNSRFVGEDWLKSENTDRMWKIAADIDVSICLLRKPNASIASMKTMIAKHPSTKVVIDHLGLVDPSNAAEVESFLSLAEYEKCHVKVSRFFTNRAEQTGTEDMLAFVEKVYGAFGSERLMWGSNAPVEVSRPDDYQRGVNLIKDAPFLKPHDLHNIFVGTADKLFF